MQMELAHHLRRSPPTLQPSCRKRILDSNLQLETHPDYFPNKWTSLDAEHRPQAQKIYLDLRYYWIYNHYIPLRDSFRESRKHRSYPDLTT